MENVQCVDKQHYSSTQILFPQSRQFFTTALESIGLPSSTYVQKFALRDLGVAVSLTLRLLYVTSVSILKASKLPGRLMAARPVLYSLFANWQRSWKIIWKWLNGFRPCEEAAVSSARLLLKNLGSLCQQVSAPIADRNLLRQICLLRVQCISELCTMEGIDSEPILPLRCAESLEALREAAIDSTDIQAGVENILLPAFSSLRAGDEMPNDLRLAIHDFSGGQSLDALMSDQRQEPLDRARFRNHQIGGIPNADEWSNETTWDEQGRARKRLRLSDENECATESSLFDILVRKVYSLLGTHQPADLEYLPKAAT